MNKEASGLRPTEDSVKGRTAARWPPLEASGPALERAVP